MQVDMKIDIEGLPVKKITFERFNDDETLAEFRTRIIAKNMPDCYKDNYELYSFYYGNHPEILPDDTKLGQIETLSFLRLE